MFIIRGLGVGVSALGSIWVARTLGPEKLGISAFAFGMVGFVTLAASLNQDYNFVRRGKQLPDGVNLGDFVSEVFSLRLGLALMLVAAGIACLLVLQPAPVWFLAIGAGIFLAVIQSNDAGWILQVRGRMPRFFMAISIQGVLNGLLWMALIRPSWPAGSDLALACVGCTCGLSFAWWSACRDGIRIRVSLANFLAGFRLLREGRWLVLMGFGTYAITSAEIPLIGTLASVEDLGLYRTAMQLINVINPFIPLLFFRLYPRLIELQRESPELVLGEQWRAFARVVMFGGPLVVGAFVLSPFVYPIIFGEVFAPAAMPFAVLFTAKVLAVGVNVFMWGGFARKMDKYVVLLVLGVSLLSLGMNALLIPHLGIMAAAMVNCGAQALLLCGNMAVMVLSHRRATA